MAEVTFHAHGKTYLATVPIGTSLLDAARACDAPEGDACGGVCACSTCHLYVTVGGDLLSEASDDEEDILDKAFDVQMTSRLGCQAKTNRRKVPKRTVLSHLFRTLTSTFRDWSRSTTGILNVRPMSQTARMLRFGA